MIHNIYTSYIKADRDVNNFFNLKINDFDTAIKNLSEKKSVLSYSHLNEIAQWNLSLNNSQLSLQNIEKLKNHDTTAVITGQQTGLLTGPLYTIYKTINCIQLSKHLSDKYNIPVIPIFWAASEDHDFDEIKTIHWQTKDNDIKSYQYNPSEYTSGLSACDIKIEDSIFHLIEEIKTSTIDTEFKENVLDIISKAINTSESMSDFFARLMVRLFGKYGLVMVSPHLKSIRELSKPLLIKEILNPTISSKKIIETNNELSEIGYTPVLSKNENQLNMFIYIDKIRTKLLFENNQYQAIDSAGNVVKNFEKFELTTLAENNPQMFSTGVVMRPVVQDYIFPTIAYIGGPGEVSYFASLKKVYDFFEVSMPIIFPRTSVVLIEPFVKRMIEKSDINIKDLFSSKGKFKTDLLNDTFKKVDLAKDFDEIKKNYILELMEFHHNVKEQYPALDAAYDKFLSYSNQNFSKFEEKLINEIKNKDDVLKSHGERATNALFPDNHHQERFYNIFVPYILKYDFGIIDKLIYSIDPFDYSIQFIEIP